ncbi:MAG: bifunctional folylpolyglutamate synthase/dihydrofolate synthase [Candidatus Omnitrophica bacterium]|nr:bifunctional folylpolyglutamate synthase/dihydrofolate synthase [Candidatus Omnitrophota bacterium]
MTYPETIQYLESFINYEKIPDYPYKESIKLERIKNFLATIDNPQDSLRCLHIAGTKGKGSTCVFIAYILREAGYRAGLYTSPHLADFRERIRILTPGSKPQIQNPDFEGMISEEELVCLVKQLRSAIERFNQDSEYGPLSFFELYTSLAFVYFKEKKVDFVVLETGLGGRLDGTNVVDPLVAAITPISYEHTQKLGNTLREIATEKAGIIKKKGLVVISAPQEKEAMQVIRKRVGEIGAKLYGVGTDIIYRKTSEGFDIKGLLGNYPDLKIRLLGDHQLTNAAVAVGAIEALGAHNIQVGINAIKDGLYYTLWPGRCEIVSCNPLIVLDGAQNIASMGALKGAVKEEFKYKRLILVLGISSDKDIKGICNEIYDLADEFILTKANNPRATEPKTLAHYFSGKEVYTTDNVKEARELACSHAKKEDLILACGSLFVVGEFRDA